MFHDQKMLADYKLSWACVIIFEDLFKGLLNFWPVTFLIVNVTNYSIKKWGKENGRISVKV